MKTTAEKLDTVFAPAAYWRPTDVTINGARISGDALVQLLDMVTNPTPDRWYRFERHGEAILVHCKLDQP